MKLVGRYKKWVISALLILVVIFLGILMLNQWRFLQELVDRKSTNMYGRYRYQNSYLSILEEITAEIILTNSISEETLKDIKKLDKRHVQINGSTEYYHPQNHKYGNFHNKIYDYVLDEFIDYTNDFFDFMSDNRIKLSDKNLEYLKNVNSKARELNSIRNKYRDSIRAEEQGKIIYNEAFSKAINEMNDSIDEDWLNELDYDYEINEKEKQDKVRRKNKKLKLEDVYGEKVFSQDEAKKAAQRFLGELGKVKRISSKGERQYDDGKILERIGFNTDNEYEVEVFIQGGKIRGIYNEKWHDLYRENKEAFDESQINISTEDAVNGVVEFLADRGIGSLEVIYVDQLGPKLEVGFVPKINGYLNMVADIFCEVDLTQEGRLIELYLDNYWQGLVYDDSGYELAIKNYEKAKNVLDSKIVFVDEKLVGRRGEGISLDFYWRFTTEYDDDEYYIYVNTETGKQDVEKVER